MKVKKSLPVPPPHKIVLPLERQFFLNFEYFLFIFVYMDKRLK